MDQNDALLWTPAADDTIGDMDRHAPERNLPMAEVFGYAPDDFSPEAVSARTNKFCPFLNGPCTKSLTTDSDGNPDPLGVCSVNHGDHVVITCPKRFLQDGRIDTDVHAVLFAAEEPVRAVAEMRLGNDDGGKGGNLDYLIQSEISRERIVPIEVQAVYCIGNVRKPFKWFMENPARAVELGWPKRSWPHPDFRSSSLKRLVPQLMVKGHFMVRSWAKTQAVVVDRPFFDTLPALPEVPQTKANLVWFVYRLEVESDGKRRLVLDKTVFTDYEGSMKALSQIPAGSFSEFLDQLDAKVETDRRTRARADRKRAVGLK